MFEDKCHERGVACKSCASALRRCADFEDVKREARKAGVDKRYMVAVRSMWMLAVARGRARGRDRIGRAKAGSGGGTRVPGTPSQPKDEPAKDPGDAPAAAADADKVVEIARHYRVNPTGPRSAVIRRCLLRCHPDKKRTGYMERDRENCEYLTRQLT